MFVVDLVARDYGGDINGLSRYDRQLLAYLERQRGLAVVLRGLARAESWPLRALRRLSGLDGAAFLQVYPARLPRMAGDLLHLTTNSHASGLGWRPGRPVVVTVHDIIHYACRGDRRLSTYRHALHRAADAWAVKALRRADAILASSAWTAAELERLAGIDRERIHVVPLGLDSERFRPQPVPADFWRRHGLEPGRPYVLHVSSEEPRKNLGTLWRAWALVRRDLPEARLLKVGGCLYPEERARSLAQLAELGVGDSVRFLDAVSDADLAVFYNLASAFVFPSLAEGFGFPVLEAMACGAPVICSTAPALIELAGGAALHHAPEDARELARLIGVALHDQRAAATLRDRGLARSASFTWERTGRQTLDIYRMLLGA